MPRLLALVSLLIATILCGSLFAANTQPTIQSINKMPLSFTKNMGQWDDRVLFRANAGGVTMWFTKEGVTYQFTRRIAIPVGSALAAARDGGPNAITAGDRKGRPYNPDERDSIEQLVLTAKFVDANPNSEVFAEGQMEYKCNYFLGNDPAKWHTDVPNYETITLKDIYPGIDLKYSGDRAGQAAYEFIAAPGTDIAQIKVAYEGAEETSIDTDGRLILKTKWGDMTAGMDSPRPVGEGSGVRTVLSGNASCAWWTSSSTTPSSDLAHGDVRQAPAGQSGTLTLSYSTYLGGESDDWGMGIAVDGSGNAYVTGRTSSSNFPIQNPYQTYQGGYYGYDAFVTKLSSSGDSLIYSTYFGGGNDDYGQGIAVDGNGNAYVTGSLKLNGFNNYDAFVIKIGGSGNSLIYSKILGGDRDDEGSGIAIDGSGNAYVTGRTSSDDFPTKNPYQTYQGPIGPTPYYDVFVSKLSSSGGLIYSTYLGGKGDDYGASIAVNGSGNAYVTGATYAMSFPTTNPYQAGQGGGDVFVTQLSILGISLIYSTLIGGTDSDAGCGIAVDDSGNAFVAGYTKSSNFPTLNPYQATYGGDGDAFVTKLSSSGSMIYSTYLGGGIDESGASIAVDDKGNAYVASSTGSYNFPTQNPFQTVQSPYPLHDVFVTKLSSSGTGLIYSTYLGGAGDDAASDIAVDGSGNAFVTGGTYSFNFPTLNPYQATCQSCGYYRNADVFVTKLYFDVVADVSDEMTPISLPEKPALDQNYPNPFNPSTEIGFDLPKPSFVSLDIYDVLGRKVTTLINERLTAGSKRVQWNGRDNTGTEVASGVYFYRLQTSDHVEVRKMVLLK